MGGRGSSSGAKGGGSFKLSESIKKEMLDVGLNSKIPGIRQKAEQGIGNYAFKNAGAVSAETMDNVIGGQMFHERNGNTLVEGFLENGRHVYYANKSDSPEIQRFRAQQTARREKEARESAEAQAKMKDFDWHGRTTSTYNQAYIREYKRNARANGRSEEEINARVAQIKSDWKIKK